MVQYSPQNEKTARAVAQLLEFHCQRLEQFYNLQLSETAIVLMAGSPQAFHAYSQYNLPQWAAAACIVSENLILVKSPSWSGSKLWQRRGVHPHRGDLTIAELVAQHLDHDAARLAALRKITERHPGATIVRDTREPEAPRRSI